MSLTKFQSRRKTSRGKAPALPPALTDQAEVVRLLAAGVRPREKNDRKRRLRKVERILAKAGPLDQAIEELREAITP